MTYWSKLTSDDFVDIRYPNRLVRGVTSTVLFPSTTPFLSAASGEGAGIFSVTGCTVVTGALSDGPLVLLSGCACERAFPDAGGDVSGRTVAGGRPTLDGGNLKGNAPTLGLIPAGCFAGISFNACFPKRPGFIEVAVAGGGSTASLSACGAPEAAGGAGGWTRVAGASGGAAAGSCPGGGGSVLATGACSLRFAVVSYGPGGSGAGLSACCGAGR